MQLTSRRAVRSGEKDNFRPDIEGLRGIAVLLVVFYHAGLLSTANILSNANTTIEADTPLRGGFIGVDLFFVISGFLITGLLIRERERNGSVSFARFYARRVRRILPAAAVCLLVTIPLAYGLVTLVVRPDTMMDAASASLSIANVRFALTTDYFHPVSYSPFLHFWSLGVEEQFYFVWPALLAVAAWRAPRLGAGIALAAIVAVSFLLSLAWTQDNPTWAFYMLPTRAWQLAAGGLLAIGAGSLDRLPLTIRNGVGQLLVVAGWLALLGLLLDAFVLDASVPYPGMAALVPTVAGVLLIASGTQPRGPGVLLSWLPIRFVGKISYSLYLWHWPMLILGSLYLVGPLRTLSPMQAYSLAFFSIPVATVSWGLVEEPFRRGIIPLPRPTRTVFAGLTVMVLVALLGTSFQVNAQNNLNDLGGDIAQVDPTASATPDSPVSPTPSPTLASLAPDATPTPVPLMTPALTFPPQPGTPSSYAVTNALRPTLANAPKDYERPWRDNCLGWTATLSPSTSSKCIYGNKSGSYTVVLVGDSHGSALFPAVNALATAHGWKLLVYLKIDCAFVDVATEEFNLHREYTECATWNRNILARLAASPPNLIVVAMSRWVYVIDKSNYGSYQAQGRAMGREMAKLPASSKKVMITDIPDPWTFVVPECLASYLSDYRRCNYARSVAFNSYYGKREAIASSATGIPLIDISKAICPGSGTCPVVQSGMIMFRDQHHLTATYAASLGPEIDRQLVDILNGPATSPPPPSPSA